MAETLFSKIISRDIPAEIVYEDAETLAFLDIKPDNPGHTLVIPKVAHENIFDVPPDVWLAVMRTVHTLAPKIMTAVGATGVNIMVNNGVTAGQEVPHLHVHIIPRHESDGYRHWTGTSYPAGDMERTGALIRAALTSAP